MANPVVEPLMLLVELPKKKFGVRISTEEPLIVASPVVIFSPVAELLMLDVALPKKNDGVKMFTFEPLAVKFSVVILTSEPLISTFEDVICSDLSAELKYIRDSPAPFLPTLKFPLPSI